MTALLHIRKNVFGLSQSALAEIAGTTQATVSRWERGELSPSLDELSRIRAEAKRRRLKWNDALVFATVKPAPAAQAADPR